MATTWTSFQPRRVGSIGNISAGNYIKVHPEAASQTYIAGELVYLASGKVTVCGTDPSLILGQAVSAATGTTDSSTTVEVIQPNQIWLMNLSGTLAQSNIGVAYGIAASSGVWTVDQTDTTNDRVVVHSKHPDAAIGDTNAPVYVTFIPASIQMNVGT